MATRHQKCARARHGKKYYATNRLTLSAMEVRQLYRIRAQIEEVIRVCKDQLAIGLSSALRAGASAPRHLLFGRILCPGAGTP